MADPVVVVGGGLAAQRFVEELRRRGLEAPIRMVCEEAEPPYDRPPLSKGVLLGTVDDRELPYRGEGWYAENGVELLLGERAVGLEAAERRLLLGGGAPLRYSRLLIATGASPLRLPFAAGLENVYELRTLADARVLRDALRDAERVAVIGAGFIGQEVAAAARALGLDVTLADALDAPLAPLLGDRVGGWLAELHRANGVELALGSAVRSLTGSRRATEVVLENGRRIACDAVVVGIGVRPATRWLAGTQLAEPGGIRVDAVGRTSIPGVLAAGDVALRYDPRARCHRRTEHWESAVLEGRTAAAAMLGAEPPPPPPPAFWSDLHGVRVQWVGDASGSDDLAIERGPGARQLAARYLRAGHTVGALLAGRPGDLPAMRREVGEGLAALASSDAGAGSAGGVDPERTRPSTTGRGDFVPAGARTAPTEPSPREPSRDEGGPT